MNCANSLEPHCISSTKHQLSASEEAVTSLESQFFSLYRVCLVKDHAVSFDENCNITNPSHAQAILNDLILTRGQPDREQFIVAMLTSKKISAFAGF